MIYITGDLHGEPERFKADGIKKLKKTDTLLICGDFGFVWNGSEKEKKILKKIGKMKPTIAFIAGCHDNYSLLSAYPEVEFCGGKARRISGKLYELLRGQIYTIEGKTVFAFGGGVSPDSLVREEGVSWWKEEMPTEQEMNRAAANLAARHNEVDYILTHDVSASLKPCIDISHDDADIDKIHTFLNTITKNVAFTAWFFGKYHQDKVIPPHYYAVFQNIVKAPGQEPPKKKKK